MKALMRTEMAKLKWNGSMAEKQKGWNLLAKEAR